MKMAMFLDYKPTDTLGARDFVRIAALFNSFSFELLFC